MQPLNYKKIGRTYTVIAQIAFTVILLVIFINTALGVFFLVKDKIHSNKWISPIKKYGMKKLMKQGVYDNYSESEIIELLSETYLRKVNFNLDAYTMFKEGYSKGKYVNISKEYGFRYIKNQSNFPPRAEDINIFIFGGSTTFGYGVADWETIASYLQEKCKTKNKNVNIYNFACGYYYSTQERILLEKLITKGIDIDIAIFIDGVNEKGKNDLPSLFQGIEKGFKIARNQFRFVDLTKYLIDKLPIGRLVTKMKRILAKGEILKKNSDSSLRSNRIKGRETFERYVINKKMLEGLCSKFGIKCFFVWQPANWLNYDQKYHVFSKKRPEHFSQKYSYQYMEKYIRIKQPVNMLYMGDIQKDYKRPLYVDECHYNSFMNKVIADYIFRWINSKKVFQS